MGDQGRIALFVAVASLSVVGSVEARALRQQGSTPAPPPAIVVPRAAGDIRIDGALGDPGWATAVAFPVDIEIRPGDNVPAPVATTCMLAYDERALYVAFRALDPHPEEIRAHLSDRDTAYRDDWVGIFLDTFDDQRRGFEFFANPLGVQMDLSNSDVATSNGNEDESWDAIWDAAGTITADGYVVEIAIPFSSLRFPQQVGPQTWGFAAMRNYPRTMRHQILSVPIRRDRNCFLCQWAKITGLEGIRPSRNLEFDPTVTGQRSDALADEDDLTSPFERGSFDAEAGLSARWGVTPNLSLNAALNPDFSQVEADLAQLAVNTRFALFYPEKRPFFQEGADFFQTPFRAVHTRAIADPSWGVKLTGKPGAQAIGVFAARDSVTNLLFPSNQGSDTDTLDQPATVGVVRYRRDVGAASTIGLLATSRAGRDYANRVVGADAVVRISENDYVDLQILGSRTRYPAAMAEAYAQPRGEFDGSAFHLTYTHDTRPWSAWVTYDDIGQNFRADLGFIPRVDTRGGEAGFEKVWWGESGHWYSRISTGVEAQRTENHAGRLTDQATTAFLHYEGPWQSSGHLELTRAREYWEGVTYDLDKAEVFWNMRPSGDFTSSVDAEFGDAIDYDNGRPARILTITPEFTLNVGRHLFVGGQHTFEQLDVDAGRLYRANLTQLRLIYQFSVRAFVRAIVHRLDVDRDRALYRDPVDRSEQMRFAQLLFSYTINPQTVFFLGYSDTREGTEVIDMFETNRTVFVKLGYAWLL